MENKKLGIIIIIITLLLAGVFGFLRYELGKNIGSRVTFGPQGECVHEEGTQCPFQELNNLMLPTSIGIALLVLSLGLGVYLIFFDKSQKILQQSHQKIVEGLKEAKTEETKKEKFSILLKGLDENEKKVILAVKEQAGITQATLRLRTDFSKAKLSAVLSGLEAKGLIAKEKEGKTNQVFLKEAV